MADLYARYSDAELALILDFATRAVAASRAETARLRAGTDGATAAAGDTTGER